MIYPCWGATVHRYSTQGARKGGQGEYTEGEAFYQGLQSCLHCLDGAHKHIFWGSQVALISGLIERMTSAHIWTVYP